MQPKSISRAATEPALEPSTGVSSYELPRSADSKPLVSVVMATLNERDAIERSLASVINQEPGDVPLEILVVDGGSSDGTTEVIEEVAARDSRVRLIRNPKRKTPIAFNLGLHAARGEYVCILGAHSVYPPDYVSVCLREMRQHQAVGCSGSIVTVSAKETLPARLAAWTLSSRFASSPRSVRTRAAGYADTVPYPVFRRQALLDIGGYDENLDRNQDNDLSQRLRARGHRLYITARTQCAYCARPSVAAVWQYAFHSGRWNGISLRLKPASMSLRHLVPAAFVAVLAVAGTALAADMQYRGVNWPKIVLALALGSYMLLAVLSAIAISVRARAIGALLLPAVFFGFHLAYGLGTIAGYLRGTKRVSPRRADSPCPPRCNPV